MKNIQAEKLAIELTKIILEKEPTLLIGGRLSSSSRADGLADFIKQLSIRLEKDLSDSPSTWG